MSTPSRLTEIECPRCHGLMWIIDPDYHGPVRDPLLREERPLSREERPYPCPTCHEASSGWTVRQQAPPEFLLQPHDLYPMAQEAFDYWVEILRTHFPAHRSLAGLGTSFVPRLPAEAAAQKANHDAAYPVGEMRDQDGARRVDPLLRDVVDWLEMMNDGDVLRLQRRDGGMLTWRRQHSTLSGECLDAAGAPLAQASAIALEAVHQISRDYLAGDVAKCVGKLRKTAAHR